MLAEKQTFETLGTDAPFIRMGAHISCVTIGYRKQQFLMTILADQPQ